MPELISNYMKAEQTSADADRTKVWCIRNLRSDDALGVIKWHGAWRSYCFFPARETVFSAGCMGDLIRFISEANGEQHAKWKGRKLEEGIK